MITIRPIRPDESMVAKRVIYRVAHEIFNDSLPLEESIMLHEESGELKDMDNIQQNYFNQDGIFLITLHEQEIIGTGGIRRLEEDICELKRFWLLTEYHGKGLGLRMIRELLSFAREKGYTFIRLETDPNAQKRAVEFYKRLGFKEVPIANASDDEDILMEMPL
jgi:putative acetyltransferase